MQQDRIAIVTGAGSGIGQHTALALIDNGFHVVFTGRREEPLRDAAVQAVDGSRAHVVTSDVTSPTSVRALFEFVANEFGRLDLLFNNAGISMFSTPIEDVDIDAWKKVVDTNLTGVFLCTQQAVRLMKKQEPQGGRIINNGSISASVPRPGSHAYTATKHAVSGLTKSTSLDGRQFNIACGQIDIGNADTSMVDKMKTGVPQADGSIAIEPTISLDDVAATIVHMANLPLNTNVPFVTVMANQMPYIGRG